MLETEYDGILASWIGSGSHNTINQALHDLDELGDNCPGSVVVHVKSGVYHENVEIQRHLRVVMFVGNGMDMIVVTCNRNVIDDSTTYSSTTFGK